jgi:hypothetical protein
MRDNISQRNWLVLMIRREGKGRVTLIPGQKRERERPVVLHHSIVVLCCVVPPPLKYDDE